MKILFRFFVKLIVYASSSNSALAAEYIPLNQPGVVCIEHVDFRLNNVTGAITEKYLFPACEGKGGISSLTRLQIRHTGHGCPYGHQFEFEVKGQCYIP